MGNGSRPRTLLTVMFSVAVSFFAHSIAFASIPSRKEVYRSSALNTVVYKDTSEEGVYWYIPPMKLLQDKGKVIFYKRDKGDRADFYFYVVPYMSQDLVEFLTYEIPGLVDATNLRPVTARQFGIQVKNYNIAGLGEKMTDREATDQQYLNTPHEVKISVQKSEIEDFEFFLENKPGIPATALISFDSEREDKFLEIKLTHKEIYDAMKAGGSGKLYFTKAEIEKNVTDYVTSKYFEMKSKGDLPMSEIVTKVIAECFTPTKKPSTFDLTFDLYASAPYSELAKLSIEDQAKYSNEWMKRAVLAMQIREPDTYEGNFLEGSGAPDEIILPRPIPKPPIGTPTTVPSGPGLPTPTLPTPSTPSGSPGSGANAQAEFKFKKDLATSESQFYYHQSHFVDTHETVLVPFFLSTVPSVEDASVKVVMLPKQEILVDEKNSSNSTVKSTSVMVSKGEQYVISANMAITAESSYKDGLRNYRWDSTWPSTDGDLYYRVGAGPWTPVNRRALIKSEGLFKGELQFYLDREKIWSRVPSDYRTADIFGLVPPIFTYQKFYPRYYVTVTGRKFSSEP